MFKVTDKTTKTRYLTPFFGVSNVDLEQVHVNWEFSLLEGFYPGQHLHIFVIRQIHI